MSTPAKEKLCYELIWLRLSQLLINERYKQDHFKIPIHLALGHEAIAVSIHNCMTNEDSLFLTHRNIHFNLIRQGSLKEEIDEYYLKPTGLAKGCLGSMNLSNIDKKVIYSSSILGNNLSVGAGFALGNKASKLKSGNVIIQTGDGAIEEGAFAESLLFASSNDLAIIFLVENNKWSLGTKISERRCNINLQKLADSFGIGYHYLEGNDIFKYIDSMSLLMKLCRESNKPFLIEVDVTTLGYRYQAMPNSGKNKFINYHAGPANELTFSGYPMIVQSNEDPLYVLLEHETREKLDEISEKLLLNLEEELA